MDPRKNVYKQYKMLGLHTPASSTKWAGRVAKDTRGRQIHNMPEYTVEGGEYFSDKMSTVARDNAVSLEQLKAANPQVTHEDRLSIGQRLKIPHSTEAPKVYEGWKPSRSKSNKARPLPPNIARDIIENSGTGRDIIENPDFDDPGVDNWRTESLTGRDSWETKPKGNKNRTALGVFMKKIQRESNKPHILIPRGMGNR